MSSVYNEDVYVESVRNRAKSLSKLFSLWSKPDTVSGFRRKNRLPPRHIEFLNNVWRILEELYPGNCDVHYKLVPIFKLISNSYGANSHLHFKMFDKFIIEEAYVVIRFPEYTITNSSGHQLFIKNLFTRITLKVTSGSRGSITVEQSLYGLRTTLDIPQYFNYYLHSHLHSHDHSNSNELNFYNFCLGTSDLLSTLQLMSERSNQEFDWDMFHLLLLQIHPFIRWESLEGVPYKKIKNVIYKATDHKQFEFSNSKNVYYTLKGNIKPGENIIIKWNFYNNKYKILDTEEFEVALANIALNSGITDNSFYTFKSESGEYYSILAIVPPSTQSNPNKWIPFRNQKIFFEVTGVDSQTISNQKYLNPKIKEYVKSRLEYQVNLSKIRTLGISKLNPNTHS